MFLSLFRVPVLCGHNLINLLLRVSRALGAARRILQRPLGVMQFLRSRFLSPRSRAHYFPVTFRFRLSEKCKIQRTSGAANNNIRSLAVSEPRQSNNKIRHCRAVGAITSRFEGAPTNSYRSSRPTTRARMNADGQLERRKKRNGALPNKI